MITLNKWKQSTPDEKINIINSHAIDAELDDHDRYLLIRDIEIFDSFVIEAHKIVRKGFKHYSAEVIIGFLRHHTAVKSKDITFKISNGLKPIFSRMSMAIFPQLNGLFETRTRR